MLMHKRNPQVARPPRVRGLPVLGNTHQLLRNPAGFFPATYERYGPVFRLQVAGTRYTVLAGREAFDFFMQTGEQHFSRAVFYERFGREMGTDRFILGQPADAWTDLRRKLRLGLSRQVSSSHIPNMVAAVDRALDGVSGDWRQFVGRRRGRGIELVEADESVELVAALRNRLVEIGGGLAGFVRRAEDGMGNHPAGEQQHTDDEPDNQPASTTIHTPISVRRRQIRSDRRLTAT